MLYLQLHSGTPKGRNRSDRGSTTSTARRRRIAVSTSREVTNLIKLQGKLGIREMKENLGGEYG
jgi:hypothetical protein